MSDAQISVPTIKGSVCESCRSAIYASYSKTGESIPLCQNLSTLQLSVRAKACDFCRLVYQHVIYNTPSLEALEEPIRINWLSYDAESPEALVVSTDGGWAFLSSEHPLDKMANGKILS